jgi:hypothetical protein
MQGRSAQERTAPFDLAELLRDAESCARLSDWEEAFVNDVRGRVLLDPAYALSDKQMVVLRRIEGKVYAT